MEGGYFARRPVALLAALVTMIAVGCSAGGTTKAGPSPTCPSGDIVGWGDSLTDSQTHVSGGEWGHANPTWLETLSKDIGVDTKNFGVGGQGSAEVAVRQGGLRPRVTLQGDQIPPRSTAAIPVTNISPTDGWSVGTTEIVGTLAGVSGTLQHTVTSGASEFSFVPAVTLDEAVLIPAGAFFINADGENYRGCIQIIWAGTNNYQQKSAIVRDIASMVQNLADPKRYLIVGTLPTVDDDLSAAYGPRFVDLRGWLISDGLAAAGIVPTPEDAAAQATNDLAPSLTGDGTHFTQAAYTAIGHHLASAIKSVGLV